MRKESKGTLLARDGSYSLQKSIQEDIPSSQGGRKYLQSERLDMQCRINGTGSENRYGNIISRITWDVALLISDKSGSDEQERKSKRGAAWLPKNCNKLTVGDETHVDHLLCHG